MTAEVARPAGYGRILRDDFGALVAVVEHRDASAAQRAIHEINTGLLAAPARDLLAYLPRVGNENAQGEYYLPDVLSLAVAEGGRWPPAGRIRRWRFWASTTSSNSIRWSASTSAARPKR